MGTEKATLLDRMLENSFPINLLYEARSNRYTQPIADLILASQSILERSQKEWTYKSLAEFGEEEFIRTAHLFYHQERDWVGEAIRDFSLHVWQLALFEENEGLIFYIQENGKYRVARNGDPAYDFVCRLRDEDSLSDLRFSSTPKWAHELFIFRPNYQAYCLMWHDRSDTSDPNYRQSKKLKAEAVIRETARLAGGIASLMESTDVEGTDDSADDTPLTAKERNTLLIVIEALCRYTDIKSQERGTASKIAALTHSVGAPVGDDAVRAVLKKIPNALETRMK
jgi:hypothetical protein